MLRSVAVNELYYGDNLRILREEIASGSTDLVYLDPPFNSNRTYNVLFKSKSGQDATAQIEAFDDTWTWGQEAEERYFDLLRAGSSRVSDTIEALRKLVGETDMLAYLVMMGARILELHRVLKSSGGLYLHCDPTASHYLKLLLDSVFSPMSFRNEIVWKRTGAHGAAKRYAPVHDILLYYAKGSGETWVGGFHPYTEEYLSSKYKYTDSTGTYRLITLFPAGTRNGETGREWRGINPTAKGVHWRYPPAKLDDLDAAGMIYWGKEGKGLPQLKRYLNEGEGVPLQDVWTDIPPINSQAAERLGYPTQKPVRLLERIIQASSRPGDVVLDPFCGCGTTVDAAQRLDRRWVGIDITYLAIDLIDKRLQHTYGPDIRKSFRIHGIPHDLDGAKALFDANPFDFERWAVSLVDGQSNEKQVGDKEIDGIIRFPVDNKNNSAAALVSVKGGKNLGPGLVRDLIGAVQARRAEMGVFVCLASPTPGMIDAAKHSGSYQWPVNGQWYPKVQIVTVAELLAGNKPNMPTPFLPYIQAKQLVPDNQRSLF